MTFSDFIKDVGEIDFEYEVLQYSKSLPVLAYFWATWCKPCKAMHPMLEMLATQAGGGFRLARIDADANPNLAIQYSVRTLPTIKAFVDGEASASLIGPQPEERILHFLRSIAPPSQFHLDIEKAQGLLAARDWAGAEKEFRRVLDEEPGNTAALLGLVKSLVPQGQFREALNLLEVFPASHDYQSAEKILPLVEELVFFSNPEGEKADDLLPAYQNSLNLVKKGNYPAALDGLLDILRSSREYRRGKTRQVVLAVLELMGSSDPLAREYRVELASILF